MYQITISVHIHFKKITIGGHAPGPPRKLVATSPQNDKSQDKVI